jgi:hypothetical protein
LGFVLTQQNKLPWLDSIHRKLFSTALRCLPESNKIF